MLVREYRPSLGSGRFANETIEPAVAIKSAWLGRRLDLYQLKTDCGSTNLGNMVLLTDTICSRGNDVLIEASII